MKAVFPIQVLNQADELHGGGVVNHVLEWKKQGRPGVLDLLLPSCSLLGMLCLVISHTEDPL